MCSLILCCFRCLCKTDDKEDNKSVNDKRDSNRNSLSVYTPPSLNVQPFENSSLSFLHHRESTSQDTTVVVWGINKNGELGSGMKDKVSTPTKLKFVFNIISVSCGETHSLFLLDNGTLYSCGSNECGQLGHDRDNNKLHYVEGFEGYIVSAKAGFAHNLAIDSVGKLYSWGSNSHGQLGLDLKASKKFVKRPQVVVSLLNKTVVQVATGQYHSVVLTNLGDIYTCGSNSHGQLGQGPDQVGILRKFDLVPSLRGFPTSLIVSGGFHSFALSVSGAVCGWGKNSCGQLGVGDTEDKWLPTGLRSVRSLIIKYIDAGLEHTAFLTQDGGLFTCGNGVHGQLGHESFSNSILPRKILEFGSVVSQIACGHNHTLCLTENRLHYFGFDSGSVFEMADSEGNLNSPALVNIPEVVHSIFAGGHQSFLLVCPNPGIVHNISINCDYRFRKSANQILGITETSVSKINSISHRNELDEFTRQLIFSSSSWNASFLLDSKDPCSSKNIGIDLELGEMTLSKLNPFKSQNVKEYFEDLMFTDLLKSLPDKIENKEMLRFYVLLTMLPSFYTGNNENLVTSYFNKVQSLYPKTRDVIIRWLFNSPIENILRIISVLKKTIISILDSDSWNDSQKDTMCKTCLTVLGQFYVLNKVKKLSHHTFTIPQLASKISISLDYLKWIEKYSFAFCDFPFVFDEKAKTVLLQTDQAVQMRSAMAQAASKGFLHNALEIGYLVLNVNRNNLVMDVITQIQYLETKELKKPIRIKFVDEEAEDAGGVRKEFFLLLLSEILDAKFGMFKFYDDSRLMWFNENSFEESKMYSLIGIMCGLAIYNFTIINLPFPLALYKKLLGGHVDLSDLKELNPLVANSLEQILNYTEPDLETTFSLNFEIAQESYGKVNIVPLKKGGSNIPVTQENKAEFVDLYVSYLFNSSTESQFKAFKEGFERVCGSNILQLFHPTELQAMVTGNEDYVWGELEENCTYEGGYHAKHEVIQRFWLVFHSLSHEEKKQFLLFLTGSDRIPITGMKDIKMSIHPYLNDENYLPLAHTCFDILDLPPYSSEELMKTKLIQAIEQHHGFSLI